MNSRVRVPIRIQPRFRPRVASRQVPPITESAPPVVEREQVGPAGPGVVSVPPDRTAVRDERRTPATRRETRAEQAMEEEGLELWRDRAMRLQAEMENFRKRQRRLADERFTADRERLLRAFLRVSDDLERALGADGADADSLRRGVDLTHQGLMRVLNQEGVEPIQVVGQPFDPTWHEAVSALPHQQTSAKPNTVVEVVQTGYRLEDRLLRPARVIVAT